MHSSHRISIKSMWNLAANTRLHISSGICHTNFPTRIFYVFIFPFCLFVSQVHLTLFINFPNNTYRLLSINVDLRLHALNEPVYSRDLEACGLSPNNLRYWLPATGRFQYSQQRGCTRLVNWFAWTECRQLYVMCVTSSRHSPVSVPGIHTACDQSYWVQVLCKSSQLLNQVGRYIIITQERKLLRYQEVSRSILN